MRVSPDVVIIGSGMGGATLAASLAPTGAEILILERGQQIPDDAPARDPDRIYRNSAFRSDETWLDADGNPFSPGNYYNVGGNTKLYGAVLYRDIGDEYVTKTHAFTTDIPGFDQALKSIQARGGGDGPESLNQGLAVAVGELSWRPDAARLAFLIADAPPHMDYQDDVTYGRSALAAIHHGIRIHTVAASGLDDRGSMVFRQVAQLSGGEFIFIEYGSVAAAAADHGVSAPVGSNNLDDIFYQRIHSELVGWGHDGDAISAR